LYLADNNVWLAMTWDLHPQNRAASKWFAGLPKRGVELLFCRFTMLGFLRLLTNEAVMGDSVATLGQAFEIYDRWLLDPRVSLAAEPRGAEVILRETAEPFRSMTATKAIADCYLAGFAEATGAHIVTFDRGLAATARSRKNPVVFPA
jgi:toxin-antitoxin system PIN domain toxin